MVGVCIALRHEVDGTAQSRRKRPVVLRNLVGYAGLKTVSALCSPTGSLWELFYSPDAVAPTKQRMANCERRILSLQQVAAGHK
ncbi:unnamed protein product [Parajaminaea phylloscopi]